MVLTKLEGIMKRLNMSSEELAAKITMTSRTIDTARKKRGVSLGTCKRIASGLEMELKKLI